MNSHVLNFSFLQERVHDLLGTTGNTDTGEAADMAATARSYKDFTHNGRTFSSSGLLPLPAWARNNNGIVVEGESETGPSLTQTLDALDMGRTQDTISSEVHHNKELHDAEDDDEDESDGVDEENDNEGEVVVPKPLNDVSNVFFNNSLPSGNQNHESAVAERIPEFHPVNTQSPQLPLGNSFNSQSPSVPLLEPDDSWISNPSVPYFHRLSDIDASGAFQHSVNETLATVTDDMVANEQEANNTRDLNDSMVPNEESANMGTTLENSDKELLETARSQKTSSSYHSDVDVAEHVESENEVPMSNSKRRLDFNTDDSQHDSDGSVTHRAEDNLLDTETALRSPHGNRKNVEEDLLDAENPASLPAVSRTSLSPGSRSGSSRGSARKAARYRRELEYHRHGAADSSDDEDYRPVYQRSRSPESDGEPESRSQRAKESASYKRTTSSTDTAGYRSDRSEQSTVSSPKTSNAVNREHIRLVLQNVFFNIIFVITAK